MTCVPRLLPGFLFAYRPMLSYNVRHMNNTKEITMPTASFTTRIDSDLKKSLERIAEYEDRSASWVANRAIKAFVEEREATRALVNTGLELVERGTQGVPSGAIHQWLKDDEAKPFPKSDS